MTDRLDLEAIKERNRGWPQKGEIVALIAEVERLQEKESEGSWLREQLRRTQVEMDRLRADVARKDEALREIYERPTAISFVSQSAATMKDACSFRWAKELAEAALSESEEQAVSRPERGTEGVGLSGETSPEPEPDDDGPRCEHGTFVGGMEMCHQCLNGGRRPGVLHPPQAPQPKGGAR